MIITVPPNVERIMRERACRMGDSPEISAIIHRALIEAWTEGVAYAWTIQDIKDTSGSFRK